MKTFREIAEMHYSTEPNNEADKQYRFNRINALENLLTEQCNIANVVFSEAELKAKLEEQKEEIRQWLIGEDFEGLAESL